MVRKNNRRPRLFQSQSQMKKALTNLGNNLSNQVLDETAQAIAKSKPQGMEVKRKPKYLQVTEKRLDSMGVIDLKPYFAQSSKRKTSKDGGWYLTVPIRRKARGMSRRMYEQLRAIDIQPNTRKTVISDYLYDKRESSDAGMLNYTPTSNNITKIKVGNNRHDYVAFRTVSDKSPASSWIVNRGKVTVNNTSKTFVSNVNRLMKWNMKNGV
ncbi:hypothetical protein BigBertha_78 [Bacillus phage BigBertha]|uniref:Uncharacterized protein n=5 Tax=Caudoviricetes TaxID=2731619 RepID=A0A7U3T8L5_9CAUD|nr:hypothetical protein TROLL_81 [Bacillus phage Troll]YP_008771105.1 hypothetical protein BigBertha_78 [Bacillus phage BigBertha]YP_009206434.1 hypothetical protein AVV02_gp079 [Bacillus phage AvesoBmore]YP_009289957.1 hypothetical protein BI003_gp078 [Bacillus phage Phrodo]QPY77313.1 hypothetical protein ANTHOS_76 [Bacillus phage Anthos]UGO48890.1 hypothetical protein JARJAR_76 [Bacillus phage vB_BanH_JarJar]UGO50381.1 hypothetical protein RONSWANSON_75 [Bacillus phage vB_BanH_RonSwanson]A